MRIIIFHGRLTLPTGGEVNTRDWSLGLKARGHRVVVFTVYPGPLAEQIRNSGIAVVDNPSSISDAPDIMFGAGINDVATLVARFPEMELAGKPDPAVSAFLNQLKLLPVRWAE